MVKTPQFLDYQRLDDYNPKVKVKVGQPETQEVKGQQALRIKYFIL